MYAVPTTMLSNMQKDRMSQAPFESHRDVRPGWKPETVLPRLHSSDEITLEY